MTNTECPQCGSFNLSGNEICEVCGADCRAGKPFPYLDLKLNDDGRKFDTGSTSITSIGAFYGVGDVLGPTLSLFFKNFWLITKIVFVIVAPFEIFKAMSVGEIVDDWQLSSGLFILELACKVLIAPALIFALMKVIQTGTAPGVNESYRWGFGKLGRLIVCAAIAGLLQGLGLAFCIIPGIIIGVSLALVYPLAVLEKGSPAEILQRSHDLTKGHRWKIFGALFVLEVSLGLIGFSSAGVASSLTMEGPAFWPIYVVAAIVADIMGQATTILSLVIYLSILRTLDSAN